METLTYYAYSLIAAILALIIPAVVVIYVVPYVCEVLSAIFQKMKENEKPKKNIQVIRLGYKDEKEKRNIEWAHQMGLPEIFGRLINIRLGTQPLCGRSSPFRWLNTILDWPQIKEHRKWIREMEKKPAWGLLSDEQKDILRRHY